MMTDREEFEKHWLTKFSAEFLDSDNCWSAWTGWQARGELDKALAETQEPVARINVNKRRLEFVTPMDWSNLSTVAYYPDIDLYTTPSREWQSLSDDEIIYMYNEPSSDAEMLEFARAVEAKLRVKNNG
jgi:hypothetical protein